MPHSVTLIPGDGIGPAVIDAARRVVEATGVVIDWDIHQVGTPALEQGLETLPEAVLESVRSTHTALKGPVSTPIGRVGFRSVNVELRRSLALYAQVRPCRTRPGVVAPFDNVDLVVIRETTEDLYAGIEFPPGSDGAADVVAAAERHGRGVIPTGAGISVKFVTEAACRRVLEFAVEYARKCGRRKLTVVHKATVMRCTDGVFLEVARDVAAGVADLEYEEQQIDNLCGQLVRRPQDFDVMVMGIHYGDIVSDIAAGLAGGIGMVPGINVGLDGVMFEPAHGTAPRHAGLDHANPTASILCGALLLDHLGESDAARRVELAIEAVMRDGRYVTYDLRSPQDPRPVAGTEAMTEAVLAALGRT